MREGYVRQLIGEINKRPCIWDPKNADFNNKVQKERCWKIIQLELQYLYNHEDIQVADLKFTYENLTKAVKFGYSISNPSIFEFTSAIKWFKMEDYKKSVKSRNDGVPPPFLFWNIIVQYAFNTMLFLIYCYMTTKENLFVASGNIMHAVIFILWAFFQITLYIDAIGVHRKMTIEVGRFRDDMRYIVGLPMAQAVFIPAAIWLQRCSRSYPDDVIIVNDTWDLFISIPVIMMVACSAIQHSLKKSRPPLRKPLIMVLINDLISVFLLSYYSFFVFENLSYLVFSVWIFGNSLIHNYSNYMLWKNSLTHFPKFTEKHLRTITVQSSYACDFVIEG